MNASAPVSMSPAEVVQHQLDAYNAKDLERLVSIYATQAELYEHPATLLARGSDQIRARFQLRFQEPNLQASLIQRMVVGAFVIDQELIQRTFPEGPGTLEMAAIYQVEDGHIVKAWFISGAKVVASR